MKGIFGIRDLAEIQCGIRENEKILDGIWHLTTFREAGLAKILARDAVLGKKRVFGVGMTEVLVAGFDGIRDSTVTGEAYFAKILAQDVY